MQYKEQVGDLRKLENHLTDTSENSTKLLLLYSKILEKVLYIYFKIIYGLMRN